MNKPVAWMLNGKLHECDPSDWAKEQYPDDDVIPLYTHPVKELKNIVVASATCSCGKVMEVTNLQPVKELNDGGEPVKNATYWKRQYNLMATQNDNLKSGLYHANEQIKYLEGQLDIRTRELIGASFYEHDYKTLMEKPPLTDKEIEQIGRKEFGYWDSYNEELLDFARAILRKAQEK